VTLSIVREQGSSGELAIHYQTKPALYQPQSNQATAGEDYLAKDDTIIMIDGATVALVTVTILPVRMECLIIEKLTKSAITTLFFHYFVCICICFFKDDIPELTESFLVNITGVQLIRGSAGAGQPSVKRPGMEVAEITIEENDDPRGVLQLNVSEVSTEHADNKILMVSMEIKSMSHFRDLFGWDFFL